MDRQIVYSGQIPFETDVLNTNRYGMIGLGLLALDILGASTVASGLACTATAPASLNVQIAPGRLYSLQNVDNTTYSTLPADTTHQILKQGILADAALVGCAAPGTFGFSINYLIQASYQDTDSNIVALPYYNAQNPSQAWSGPGNNGSSQATTRAGTILVQAKAGTAATTGTQTTPAPDAGFVGLYVVTVANGQTTITAGNISTLTTAPFLTQSLLAQLQSQRIRMQANTTFYVATTGNDANTGLTVGSPWATVQHAISVLQKSYDLNGFTATILRANGTYNESVSVAGPLVGQVGAANLVISASGSANVTVNATSGSCYDASAGGSFTVQNQKLVATSGTGICLSASSATIQHSGCNFGAANLYHCNAAYGGAVSAVGNYTISGSAVAHATASGCGSVIFSGLTVTLTGTPAFTQFAFALQLGFISSNLCTFSGSATGSRYTVSRNGMIETLGGGANYFPGNAAGTANTGGVYD